MAWKTRFLVAASLALALFFTGATWLYFDPTPAAFAAANAVALPLSKALLLGVVTGAAFGWYAHRRWVAWIVRQDPTNWSNDPGYWGGKRTPEL
jgi:hypothetical protein